MDNPIGVGASSSIYREKLFLPSLREQHMIDDGMVAVKVFSTDVNIDSFHQELAIMFKLSFCPYVMRLYGYTQESRRLTLIMRLCPYSLDELIHNRAAFQIKEKVWRSIFSGITRGLIAMHSEYIAHLDVKPSNIMIECSYKSINSFTPLLTDFGLSQSFSSSNIKGWKPSKLRGASIQYW